MRPYEDGDTFTKPLLNQIMWRNSTANNLVILGPVKKGTAGGEAGSAGQMEVSCHGIAGIWVAFFSRCQRYRCGQACAASVPDPFMCASVPNAYKASKVPTIVSNNAFVSLTAVCPAASPADVADF